MDWDEVHDRYQASVEAGLDTESFYITMDEMIWELNDDHSAYLNPQQVAADEAAYAGNNDYVGIGVWVLFKRGKGPGGGAADFPGQSGGSRRDQIA